MSAVLVFTAFVGSAFWATPFSHYLPAGTHLEQLRELHHGTHGAHARACC